MALAVILFSFFYLSSHAQCLESFQSTGSETIRGLINVANNHYRNLIIQDIALASQVPTEEVTITFDFNCQYRVDQCDKDQVTIMVLPVCAQCYPLEYRGFDIAGSVRPETADLVFQIVNEMGILVDSVLFLNIPLESDTGLYTMRQLMKDPKEGRLTFRFSHALFHYTRNSYDKFRDRILEIDWYYAASEMADSVLKWKASGFLEETDSLPLFLLVQLELNRILSYISGNSNLSKIGFPSYDPVGLAAKMQEIDRLNTRYKTILSQSMSLERMAPNTGEVRSTVHHFIQWLDYYHNMAYTEDFRNAVFLEELASPGLTNGLLLRTGITLRADYGCPPFYLANIADILAKCLAGKGSEFNKSGNQLAALEYYESALKIALYGRKFMGLDSLLPLICKMRTEIVSSYLGISEKACQAGNPAMAATYFKEAVKLVSHNSYVPCGSFSLNEFENWLYSFFLRKSKELLAGNEYRKAMPYLEEIQAGCGPNTSFSCPAELPELFRQARTAIYRETLYKVNTLLIQEEFSEAEALLTQAVNIRLASGYGIARDPVERRCEGVLRQRHYEDYLEEGTRNYYWKEYDIALYYFNKALILESHNLPKADPRLYDLRQDAARQVIKKLMPDTRARALMYDFEGYQDYLGKVSDMIREYRFAVSDEIVTEFGILKADAFLLLCKKVAEEYQAMMDQTLAAKREGNYILAWQLAGKTVNFSLDHLECGLRDSEAWYEKVILEPLAVYQEKYLLLENYEDITPVEYIQAYQDLSSYYYRNKLLNQGIALEPFHELVMKAGDAGFLRGMLDYYIRQNSLEKGLEVLKKLHTIDADPKFLEEEQKSLALLFVKRDVVMKGSENPWEILGTYVDNDRWYSDFRWSYKRGWILETGGNPRYYPFIWKK